MIEVLQISTQKRMEESQAANRRKLVKQLAAPTSAQKSAHLQQQAKIDERLAAFTSEQNAEEKQQQTTPIDGIKLFIPAKPDYSNLKCFNAGKMSHSAKVCRQPRRLMPPAGDGNYFYCHQPGHFKIL